MPVVNPLARELVFKIVYYGPGLGGKTTSLQYIHAETRPEHRGKMVSLATPVDRTLYFDYLPIRIPDVHALAVRLQLFTVPGQVYYNATRKLVLTGADGIIFVADSQRLRAEANQESYDNLRDNVREHGRELDEMPHVIQYNKRDLPDVLSFDELDRSVNRHRAPAIGTVATRGDGVFESLEAVTRLVIRDFEKRVPEPGAPEFGGLELPEGGLAEALRRAEGDLPPRSPTPLPPRFNPSGIEGLQLPPDPVPELRTHVPVGIDARLQTDPAPPPLAEDALYRHATLSFSGEALTDLDGPPAASRLSEEPTFELRRKDGSGAPVTAASAVASLPVQGPMTLQAMPAPPANPPIQIGMARLPSELGLSFAQLWPTSEQGVARDVESALGSGDAARVATGCDQLVSRALAGVAGVLGATAEAPRDPATIALLLGLDGRRYLGFRLLVRDIRGGRRVGGPELLSLYAFAIDTRLARVRAIG